jgi:hypothetical protein
MESIPQIIGRLIESMEDFSSFKDEVHELSLEMARELGAMVLRTIDDRLMEEREEGLSVVGKRRITIITMFGSLTLERRLYRDRNGNYRYLLDEAIGLKKGVRLSAPLQEIALELASQGPFRFAANVISRFTKERVSHMTLHNMVSSCGDEKNDEEESFRVALFEKGELPPSEGRKVDRLMVEADGVGIALHREEKKHTEIKLALAYEGWESGGIKKFRTVGKTVHLSLCPGEEFWQDFSLTLARKYDLASAGELILGGDGAPWITSGCSIIPFKRFQLDRFHLRRALGEAFGPDRAKVRMAYRCACEGDVKKLTSMLEEEEKTVTSEEKGRRMGEVRRYLEKNREGLSDWRQGRARSEQTRHGHHRDQRRQDTRQPR